MSIERRTFLKYALAGCSCCVAPALSQAADHAATNWSYEGATGPAHWGELSPDFKTCSLGQQQTPIDLTSAMKPDVGITIDYRAFPLRLANNGHTIQATLGGESRCSITLDRARYDLAQFHFHHPSEHLLDGVAFDMEAHLVHATPKGNLAVVGIFMKAGAHNAALDVIFNHLPLNAGSDVLASHSFDPAVLLPANRSAFRYTGSLTTPPCTEGLAWTVFREPIEVSSEQIRRFALLFPNNARPVQQQKEQPIAQAGRT